jgi:NitT/TauT family transport system substrate-binding protein
MAILDNLTASSLHRSNMKVFTPPRLPMHRRTALAWGMSAAGALALAGCAEPVASLRVGSIVFTGYELMFLARDLGLLVERNVRLVELVSNTDALRALAAGQIDAAALTLDELMSARADGVDLKVVLVLDVSAGADVVLGKPGISLDKLAGKRVGAEDSAGGAIMLSALLRAAGLHVGQIRKVPTTLAASEALYRSGLVDAVVTAEPWAGRLEKLGARRLFDSTAIPGRIVDVLGVRAEVIESHSLALRQLVAGHFSALKHMQGNALDASRRMAPRLQTPINEVMLGFQGLQFPDATENLAMMGAGGSLEKTLADLQKVMVDAALLDHAQRFDDLIDTRFLRT